MDFAGAVFDNTTARGEIPSKELRKTYLKALELHRPGDLDRISQVLSNCWHLEYGYDFRLQFMAD